MFGAVATKQGILLATINTVTLFLPPILDPFTAQKHHIW